MLYKFSVSSSPKNYVVISYLHMQQELWIGVFEYLTQFGNIWLQQEQLSPESFRLLVVVKFLNELSVIGTIGNGLPRTLKSLLYNPTTFGSNTSGLACWVKGDCSMVGFAESGVPALGFTEAMNESRFSRHSGRIVSLFD